MKFKVGDKVRCIDNQYAVGFLEKDRVYTVAREEFVYTDSDKGGYSAVRLKELPWGWESFRFELAEQPKQPEPQVGDVWANEDKSRVVKVVSVFSDMDFPKGRIGYVILKCEPFLVKGYTTSVSYEGFLENNPVLLHRETAKLKKQPKPQQAKAKKEEKWEPIYLAGVDSDRAFRKGNSVKWVEYNGSEGIATCNKKDEFSLMFGVDLAWHRAMISSHKEAIESMTGRKEGVK